MTQNKEKVNKTTDRSAYYQELKLKMDSLTVFSDLKADPVMLGLRRLLETFAVADYSDFVAALYPYTDNLSEYVLDVVLKDDNFYVKSIASGRDPGALINEAVKNELSILEEVSALTAEDLQREVLDAQEHVVGFASQEIDAPMPIQLPAWKTSNLQLAAEFTRKLGSLAQTGYGVFARYTFFRLVDSVLTPVAHPDFQKLEQLHGYERERNLIIKNTEALISGNGANNMLLYGDMGTGKSSTIKAVATAYADQGLRIIEVKKNQLFQIPDLMEQLSANPLKFILFIDDLSFAGTDDNFSALKATLEGSISGTGNNSVIYATSNRRHLVRESASDRQGADDLHLNDTLQETMSLAARFGLTITFQKPDKDEYLEIVKALAVEYGITDISEEELFRKAEAHAIRRNGRSPRTARQFIELLKIGI